MPDTSLHPFEDMQLPDLLDLQAQERGSKPFLIWRPFHGESKEYSYSEFARLTRSVANGLKANGIKRGDHVLVHLDNCPAFLLSWFACARLGAVAVTTNTRSAGDEIAYFAENCGAVAAITQPKFAELLREHCPGLKWIAVTETENDGAPASQSLQNYKSFEAFLDEMDMFEREEFGPLTPSSVMYTSGTTSRPKGVVWTHANGLWAARASAFHEGLGSDDIHLCFLPLFHMNAISCSVLATLQVGATVVLQPKFSASRFWDVAMAHQCTWVSIIPFCINAIRGQEIPDHHFRCWGLGLTAPNIDQEFGVRTLGWWGMTETISVGIVSSTYYEDTPMCLGRPSPLYQIAIVDDDNVPVAHGETGHLKIKGIPGVSLFYHYLNNPEATRESFDEDGFFRTGDRATLLTDGSIKFADRSKDMLKVGGENVSASEIERVIMAVPGVQEVAVVAKPDKFLNEIPVAFVIPVEPGKGLEKSILEACEQNLADFKRPREVRFIDEFPRANLEKIAKVELRKQLVDEMPSQI